MRKYGGIYAVLYALFEANGALDRAAMKAQVQLMLETGVDGITVLGLATEVQKLSPEEQRNIIEWAAEDVSGQRPLSVTISGNSVAAQRSLVNFALQHQASWLILQPPSVGTYSGDVYLDFFADVARGFDIPFAIQNAPQYLGRALSTDDIAQLVSRSPNFSLIKAETSAVDLAGLIARCGNELTVLNGRAGLEMTDCLRAGAHGFILAPDAIDHCKAVFDLWSRGDFIQAEEKFREVLPAIVFAMQSLEHLICYGKRIFGKRAGFKIHDRAPAQSPTEFGLRATCNWADYLGQFRKPLK